MLKRICAFFVALCVSFNSFANSPTAPDAVLTDFDKKYGPKISRKTITEPISGDEFCWERLDKDMSCTIAEECYKAELLDSGQNAYKPKLKVTYRLCVLGMGGNSTMIVDYAGGCDSLHARRFCARVGVPGAKTARDTYQAIKNDPTNEKARVCLYEDWLDAGDNDWYSQPFHEGFDKTNPEHFDKAAEEEALAQVGNDGGTEYAVSGGLIAASVIFPFLAPFLIAGGIAGFLNSIGWIFQIQNHMVIENTDVCTRLPVAPYPPPFYFQLQEVDPPSVHRRVCSREVLFNGVTGEAERNQDGTYKTMVESVKRNNLCVMSNQLSDFKTTYVEVGYQNIVNLCEQPNKISNCVKIKGSVAEIRDHHHLLKRCSGGSTPCFEDYTQGGFLQEVRVLYSGDLKNVLWSDEVVKPPLVPSAVEIVKAGGFDFFKRIYYSFAHDPKAPNADVREEEIKPLYFYGLLGMVVPFTSSCKFRLEKDAAKAENVSLIKECSRGGAQEVESFKRAPLPNPEVFPCDANSPCDGTNLHNEPRLRFEIDGESQEIGIKNNGLSEKASLFGYKFETFVTDDDFIYPMGGNYLTKNHKFEQEIIGQYVDNDQDKDYLGGYEAKNGKYLRGGTKICLKNYKSLHLFLAENVEFKQNSDKITVTSPFKIDLEFPELSADQLKTEHNFDKVNGNVDPQRAADSIKYGYMTRQKTEAELGHCVDVVQITDGECEAVSSSDASFKPRENGYAEWGRTQFGDSVRGSCISGYKKSGQDPKRKCIRGFSGPVFGVVENPCESE